MTTVPDRNTFENALRRPSALGHRQSAEGVPRRGRPDRRLRPRRRVRHRRERPLLRQPGPQGHGHRFPRKTRRPADSGGIGCDLVGSVSTGERSTRAKLDRPDPARRGYPQPGRTRTSGELCALSRPSLTGRRTASRAGTAARRQSYPVLQTAVQGPPPELAE